MFFLRAREQKNSLNHNKKYVFWRSDSVVASTG